MASAAPACRRSRRRRRCRARSWPTPPAGTRTTPPGSTAGRRRCCPRPGTKGSSKQDDSAGQQQVAVGGRGPGSGVTANSVMTLAPATPPSMRAWSGRSGARSRGRFGDHDVAQPLSRKTMGITTALASGAKTGWPMWGHPPSRRTATSRGGARSDGNLGGVPEDHQDCRWPRRSPRPPSARPSSVRRARFHPAVHSAGGGGRRVMSGTAGSYRLPPFRRRNRRGHRGLGTVDQAGGGGSRHNLGIRWAGDAQSAVTDRADRGRYGRDRPGAGLRPGP